MRGRRERRYLTDKYQARQIRLGRKANLNYPYDEQRYLRRPLAIRQRFIDILSGNYTIYKGWARTQIGLDDFYSRSDVIGRLRRHSFDDCSNPKCPSCSNPRRGWCWGTGKDMITLPERRALLHLKEELEVYKEKRNEKVKSITAR